HLLPNPVVYPPDLEDPLGVLLLYVPGENREKGGKQRVTQYRVVDASRVAHLDLLLRAPLELLVERRLVDQLEADHLDHPRRRHEVGYLLQSFALAAELARTVACWIDRFDLVDAVSEGRLLRKVDRMKEVYPVPGEGHSRPARFQSTPPKAAANLRLCQVEAGHAPYEWEIEGHARGGEVGGGLARCEVLYLDRLERRTRICQRGGDYREDVGANPLVCRGHVYE